MSAHRLGMDVDSIQAGSNGINDVADQVSEAVEHIEKSLAAIGAPWGTGTVGMLIGQIYEGIHNLALGCYESNVDVVDQYVAALDASAAVFRVAGEVSATEARELEELIAELLPSRNPPPGTGGAP